MLIQKILIQYLLNPIARVTERIPEKSRDRVFVLAGLGIFIQFFLRNMGVATYRMLMFFAIDCVFLGIMLLASLTGPVKPVRFKKPMAIFWFAAGLMILQSGILLNMDYLPEAVMLLAVYPVIFICWNSADRTRIFKLLIQICRVSAVLFLVASFLLAKIDYANYCGIFNNTNGCAGYLSVVCTCLLIEIIYAEKLNKKCIGDVILLGASVAILYYTNSRTGQLATLLIIAVCSLMFCRAHTREENVAFAKRGAACVLSMLIGVFGLVYLFQLRQFIPMYYYDSINSKWHYDDMWAHVFDEPSKQAIESTGSGEDQENIDWVLEPEEEIPADIVTDDDWEEVPETEPVEEETEAEAYVSPAYVITRLSNVQQNPMPMAPLSATEEEEEYTVPEGFFGIGGFQSEHSDKNSSEDKTLDQYSTGRISIWRTYVMRLNLFGHSSVPTLYLEERNADIGTTHMSVLQIAYQSGIIAGVLYLLMNICAIIGSLFFAWRNRREKYALMPMALTIVFMVNSLLGSHVVSFWYMTTLYFYLIQFPVMAAAQEDPSGDTKTEA